MWSKLMGEKIPARSPLNLEHILQYIPIYMDKVV